MLAYRERLCTTDSTDLGSFLLVHFKFCRCVTTAFGVEQRHESKLIKCLGHVQNSHHLRALRWLKKPNLHSRQWRTEGGGWGVQTPLEILKISVESSIA